jgi:hypothetical protein
LWRREFDVSPTWKQEIAPYLNWRTAQTLLPANAFPLEAQRQITPQQEPEQDAGRSTAIRNINHDLPTHSSSGIPLFTTQTVTNGRQTVKPRRRPGDPRQS